MVTEKKHSVETKQEKKTSFADDNQMVDLELRVVRKEAHTSRAVYYVVKGEPESLETIEYFSKDDWEIRRNKLKEIFFKLEMVFMVAYIFLSFGLIITNAIGWTQLSDSVLIALAGVFAPIFLLSRWLLKEK